jgi:excisionase family DNA binding protein
MSEILKTISIDVVSLPPFLNRDQACEVLGIGRSTFYDLVKRNELPGIVRLGRQRAIRINTQILLSSLGAQEPTPEPNNPQSKD